MHDRSPVISSFCAVVLLYLLLGAATAAAAGRDLLRFPSALQWLNVERPLSAEALGGKVVILDFWSYGCIACGDMDRALRRLEAQFGSRLAVVDVHTPRFDNEKNLETLRSAVIRGDRRRPVIQDPDWRLARRYGVRTWPSLVLFAPDRSRLGRVTGATDAGRLARNIQKTLELYAQWLDESPLPLAPERTRFTGRLLAFPGKVAVSADGRRVAVSDTGHHRIVLARGDGVAEQVFGGREPGFSDGGPREARFDSPQGLVFSGGRLIVADAGNHALRLVDPERGRVVTLAGGEADGERDLRAPWALALGGQWLYVADAGSDRIWRMDLAAGRFAPYAGSRRAGSGGGDLLRAGFSQPRGLALAGGDLYVADAQTSAIRRIRTGERKVENLVDGGRYGSGDRDGLLREARLQHVGGIAALGRDRLVIADTYNHKIKLLDLGSGRVTTLLGTGRPGDRLGTAAETELNEPGGVAVLEGRVLVADTNNHRLLLLDPYKGEVAPWRLKPPPP